MQDWIGAIGARTAHITPGSPWENGFIESFNERLARRASRRRDRRIVDALNEMLRQSLSIALKDNEHQRPRLTGDIRMIRKLAILMAVVAWSSWLGTELAARHWPELFGLGAGPNSQRLITVTPGTGV